MPSVTHHDAQCDGLSNRCCNSEHSHTYGDAHLYGLADANERGDARHADPDSAAAHRHADGDAHVGPDTTAAGYLHR